MGYLAQRFPQEADVFFHFRAERHVLELYPADRHAAEFPFEGNSRNVVAGNGRNQAARAQIVGVRMGQDAEHRRAVRHVDDLLGADFRYDEFFGKLIGIASLLIPHIGIAGQLLHGQRFLPRQGMTLAEIDVGREFIKGDKLQVVFLKQPVHIRGDEVGHI